MFEKIKRAASNVRSSVEKTRAKSRGVDVDTYRSEQRELAEQKRKNELNWRKWKIDEDYRQKKTQYRKRKSSGGLFGGGLINSIADIGANVNKNVSRSGGLESFNRAVKSPGFGDPKKRKKRKKKGKVIEIRL